MSEQAPKHAAWAGLVLLAFGLIGGTAHLIIDILERAFHWQPNVFFGVISVFGLAVWWPVGAKTSLAIVVDSARSILWSWKGSPPNPPAPPAGG